MSKFCNTNSLVVVSQEVTLPICEVSELFAANVPVTSLRIKCDLKLISGGFVLEYLNPLLLIFTLFTLPISLGKAKAFAPVPSILDIVTDGNLL